MVTKGKEKKYKNFIKIWTFYPIGRVFNYIVILGLHYYSRKEICVVKRKISGLLITIILCSCLCGFVSKGEQQDYNLTVIGEEATPLASTIENNLLFSETIFIMGIMLITFIFVIYIVECRRYRSRIFSLSENECNHLSVIRLNWNLPKLKRTVKETENKLADRLLG